MTDDTIIPFTSTVMDDEDDFETEERFVEAAERKAEAYRQAVPYHEAIAGYEATAYHEAGHAVIARVLNVPITLAYISFSAGRVLCDDELNAFSEAAVIWAFAGAIAEEKFSGKPSEGASGDRWFISHHLGDYDKHSAVGDRLRARAIRLVDKHWPEIVEVAIELMRVGILRCDQIDAIMDYAPLLW